MNKIGAVVLKEIREAIPPTLFFLVLFHLIALTKAVVLSDYSITALRASVATIGALLVAKAILVVEALPVSKLFARRLVVQVLWKTLLFGSIALAFRFLEDSIPLALKHGSWAAAMNAMRSDAAWPLFWVTVLWLFAGLLLYNVAAELVRAVGLEKARELFFGPKPVH